jgi:pyruvate/2-oxoglutarate dehydrogenase complex dihydrolipoamide acyltransferase (E2) component
VANSFKLPDLGEGLTEGEVARWLVAEGQEIVEDDPLVEIQTDKATVEIPSPYAGTVLQVLVAEGEVVPVGAVLVVIGEAGEVVPGEAPAAAKPSTSRPAAPGHPRGPRVAATPLVRKVAQELGVDLAAVTGTGPDGRITEEDVRAAADGGAGVSEGRREPLRGVRRLIAEHMTRAHREVPPVTWVEECDFEGVELEHLLAIVVKAVADALPEFPELNARLDGDAIVYLDRCDIGVAVQTEQGLVVPVVRGADKRSPDELDAEIRRLADAARTGSLKPEEVRDSTFTVTSAGKLAGLFQTPIVNHPEVAILSIGRIAPRAVVDDGEVVARRTGTIAITFDHRVVDGARAASFGLEVIRRIKNGGSAVGAPAERVRSTPSRRRGACGRAGRGSLRLGTPRCADWRMPRRP